MKTERGSIEAPVGDEGTFEGMYYRVEGPSGGVPILLMHGWGCTSATVASIAAPLARSMRVYSVDLPGHGKSAEPDDTWGVEQYTAFMERFIDAVCPSVRILLGHSFGGRIGLLMSSRRPIEKLILVDAAGIKPRRSVRYYLRVYGFKTARKTLTLFLGSERAAPIIDRMRGKAGSSDYAAASPRMRAILSKCVNEDLKHVMPAIKAATLLIWGENDTATPLSDAKTMERLIPDAGLVAFPGCGHYSFLDNPRGFRAVLAEFLKNEMAAKITAD